MASNPFFKRHRLLSFLTVFSLFAAFLLFLLVALSLPIIKTVYIARLHAQVTPGQPATYVANELRFGVWGVCATGALDAPTLLSNTGKCTSPALGYKIPPDLIALIGVPPDIINVLLQGLLVVLVLHPIAAGLSLITLLFATCLASHALATLSLIASILAAIVSSIVFAADLALVIVARSKVRQLTIGSFNVSWGNAVWMVLAGVVLTWLGVIFLSIRVCFCCGFGRRYKERRDAKGKY